MSNTETLNRTDFSADDQRALLARVSTAVASLLLTICIVSFKPFNVSGPQTGEQAPGGDVVNQLGFGILGLLSLFALFCLADPRRLRGLLSPWWALMTGLLLFSVTQSATPEIVGRAALFTLITMLVITAVIVLAKDAETLSTALATMALTVLAISYFGVFALPHLAVHQADAIEAQHFGLWRGIFTHKNVAGPVMAFLGFIGFYLFRRGWQWTGGAIFVLAVVFIMNTGSKTTAGLVPLAILMVALPNLIGMRRLTVLLLFLAVISMAVGTIGIVFIEPLKDFVAENYPDMTYTGRTAVWSYSGEMIAQRPWTGYGFESFWGTPIVMDVIAPFDRDWDIRMIVNGHNGYMDIAVTMGLPALFVAVMVLIVIPGLEYMRVPHKRESIYAGDLFLMIILFGALNACLESFFFRRAEPVWLLYLFGALGMRFLVRFPFPARSE